MPQAVATATELQWPATNVELKPVNELLPYARNSRTHSPEQVSQIVRSIQQFGFTNPILCDEAGQIIAGHGRVMAAKKLSLTKVPVITARGWSEAQKKAYVIADNKLALNAGWDLEVLASEIKALDDMDFDLTLTGFSADELGDLIIDLNPEEKEGGKDGELNTVIQFNIVFDDEGQQEKWFQFVRRLKATFPDDETLGQRLAKFIDALNAGELGGGTA